MPGTPYLEKPPKGLVTWPFLLKFYALPVGIILGIAWYVDVLLYAIIVLAILATVRLFTVD